MVLNRSEEEASTHNLARSMLISRRLTIWKDHSGFSYIVPISETTDNSGSGPGTVYEEWVLPCPQSGLRDIVFHPTLCRKRGRIMQSFISSKSHVRA